MQGERGEESRAGPQKEKPYEGMRNQLLFTFKSLSAPPTLSPDRDKVLYFHQ